MGFQYEYYPLQLIKYDNLWTLSIENKNYAAISPNSKFKFRIDKGKWLDPFEGAPNKEGGDLVFLKGVIPDELRAEIRNTNNMG